MGLSAKRQISGHAMSRAPRRGPLGHVDFGNGERRLGMILNIKEVIALQMTDQHIIKI